MQPSSIRIHAVETVDPTDPANPSREHRKVMIFDTACGEQPDSEVDAEDRRAKLTDIIRALGRLPDPFEITVFLSGNSKDLVDAFSSEKIYTWGPTGLIVGGDDGPEEIEGFWEMLQL